MCYRVNSLISSSCLLFCFLNFFTGFCFFLLDFHVFLMSTSYIFLCYNNFLFLCHIGPSYLLSITTVELLVELMQLEKSLSFFLWTIQYQKLSFRCERCQATFSNTFCTCQSPNVQVSLVIYYPHIP